MILDRQNLSAEPSEIAGLKILSVKSITDERGTVRELYRTSSYNALTADFTWKQINLTQTKKGAVRGLHGENITKLVSVAKGVAFGVYVDTRLDSPTLGNVVTVKLVPGVQVLVPKGVCNGFQALEDNTEYLYFFDEEWMPQMSGVALSPLASDLNINWPISIDPTNLEQISLKDAQAPCLKDIIHSKKD